MGLPKIEITFKGLAKSAIQRSSHGVVALILKDKEGVFKINDITQIPKSLKEENKGYIQLALKGSYKATRQVIALTTESLENISETLLKLKNVKWDFLSIPDIEKKDIEIVSTWIKSLRENEHKKVQAVLPNCNGDHEGIINFTSEEIKTEEKTYSTENFCPRIAGILASTPLSISATYFVLKDVISVKEKEDPDKCIDNGELILINDGEKIKIGRAVNSLTSITEEKTKDFKKIKIVSILDLIYTDIRSTFEDYYVGKVSNSYDNKCLFITTCLGYIDGLINENLLDKKAKNEIFFNMDKQKIYLQGIGVDITKMSEIQLKEANTGANVFLGGNVKPLDAMEDLFLDMGV